MKKVLFLSLRTIDTKKSAHICHLIKVITYRDTSVKEEGLLQFRPS